MSTPFSITPTGMPVLSSGAHSGPEQGACVMELVSYLAGEKWSDHPLCTHPVLASAAQRTNDTLSDADRHLLVPLIGRLFGTTAPVDPVEAKRLSVGLALWCAERVAHLVAPEHQAVAKAAREAAVAWLDNPSEENRAATTATAFAANGAVTAAANVPSTAADWDAYASVNAAWAASTTIKAAAGSAIAAYDHAANAGSVAPFDQVSMLSGLIDEYDRLTGRTQHREVTPSDLSELRDRVESLVDVS